MACASSCTSCRGRDTWAPVRPAAENALPSYRNLSDDAVAALRGGRFPEAGGIIDQLIRLDPERAEGWSLRGLLAVEPYGDLATARESYENALARGGSVAFRLVHDHGNQQQFCIGTLRVSPADIQFMPERGDHGFRSPYADVREAAINAV